MDAMSLRSHGTILQDIQSNEIKNNNKQALFVPQGDANANAIKTEAENRIGNVSSPPPLVSQSSDQEQVLTWSAESPSEDAELEEFELLECQEIQAFLVEEEKQSQIFARTGPASSLPMGQHSMSSSSFPTEVGTRLTRKPSQDFQDIPPKSIAKDLKQTSQSTPTTSANSRIFLQAADSCVPSDTTTAHCVGVDLNMNSSPSLPQEAYTEAQPSQELKKAFGTYTNGTSKCQSRGMDVKEGHHYQQQSDLHKPEGEHSRFNETHQQGNGLFSVSKRFSVENMLPTKPCGTELTGLESKRGSKRSLSQEALACKICQKEDICKHHSLHTKPGHTYSDTSKKELEASQQKIIEMSNQGNICDQSSVPSSVERPNQHLRKRNDSPTRAVDSSPPNTTRSPTRRVPTSPSKIASSRSTQQGPPSFTSGLRVPTKFCLNSGIPKPVLVHPQRPGDSPVPEDKVDSFSPPKCPPKPKAVRPKIITYIRKSPQVKPHVDSPYEVSTLPPKLSAYSGPPMREDSKATTDPKCTPVLSASNLLFDKYRQEMQKAHFFSPSLMVSGIRPPSNTIPQKLNGKSESFYGELAHKFLPETAKLSGNLGCPKREDPTAVPFEVSSAFRPPRASRPQLGVGAVARHPSTKNRILLAGQRSGSPFSLDQHGCLNSPAEQKKPVPITTPKSFLPKSGQSGLRPPGYSRLPPARMPAFGFIRSASVSSVSSNQSVESSRSEPCRPTQRHNYESDDPLTRRITPPPSEYPKLPNHGSLQPPSTPVPTRRSLVPPPLSCRKEIQKDMEVCKPTLSSPKRFAVVSPRPQSPVNQRQKPAVSHTPPPADPPKPETPCSRAQETLATQRLRDRNRDQARRLVGLQAELRKANISLDVLAISTQHFCHKNDCAVERERQLSLELSRIRDDVASATARWERLQKEKEALELSLESNLQELRAQQEAKLARLEEDLREQHEAEKELLSVQQQSQLEELRTQQQQQMEEMTMNHEASLKEMEKSQKAAMEKLEEEHEVILRRLQMAHEQQKKSLEENFEKMRLSLQDQVDTLTFQNCSLRDRAKRFEEALRKSADEQILDALAPYQHIEEELKSLKEVLEMKNQQIHEQEKKISELEILAQKNVHLEERVQVLQQQNEDLKARIDRNLALSRQLSEENANLQQHVEKENNEKKRLSRDNEELLWRLQMGELSPRMSPASSPVHRLSPSLSSSPIHRVLPGPGSPSRVNPIPR